MRAKLVDYTLKHVEKDDDHISAVRTIIRSKRESECLILSQSRKNRLFKLLALGLSLFVASGISSGLAGEYTLPLFTPAGDPQQGFARIINHSERAGSVRIYGTDDTGQTHGPITLNLDALETRNFNSSDLEEGNVQKGLNEGLGDGVGSWRLRLESDIDIEPAAYIRTADGFLASMHDVVRAVVIGGETVHHVPIFNPGSNRKQMSFLRAINLTNATVAVTIRGLDDAGKPAPGGEIQLTVPPRGAKRLSAQELESGAPGLSGRFDDGEGKWQLFVSADGDIELVSLLQTPTGHLTNLSISSLKRTEVSAAEQLWPSGTTFTDCAECPEMVVVPASSFTMGSPTQEVDRDDDEGPVHRVIIAEPLAVGRFEVTFAQWDACHQAGGCLHNPDDQGWGRGNRPVVDVSWEDAQEYVEWLSETTEQRYRLPSESEWEYVARAGTSTRYWWGDDIGEKRANCIGCGSPVDDQRTAPVGSFSPNAFGLYDVHGNVWERTQDCWNESYEGAPVDGSAWRSGNCDANVLRGGGWDTETRYLRAANRGWQAPPHIRLFSGDASVGFRVVRTLDTLEQSHSLPLFLGAGAARLGLARIINHSYRDGTVQIYGTDDAGERFGPLYLHLNGRETRHFSSFDLAYGDPLRGLSFGLGAGRGHWRLELTSDLDIEASAYIRTRDGLLTPMHDVVRTLELEGETVHHVPIFNPDGNPSQTSWLRVTNLADVDVNVSIQGRDDAGQSAPEGEVSLVLGAAETRYISSQHLESGHDSLSGYLGDGDGMWQLFVAADRSIEVMSLLQSRTWHLSNLSRNPENEDGHVRSPEVLGITIVGLGESVLVTDSQTVTIRGLADADIAISSVNYQNLSNGVSGNAVGTHEWSAELPLTEGDNQLLFSVRAADGSVASVDTVLTYFPTLDFTTDLALSNEVLYQNEQYVDVIATIGTANFYNPTLSLERIDGDQTTVVSTLLDNGSLPDEIEGDGIYSGTFAFGRNSIDRYCYRVTVTDSRPSSYHSERECIWLTEHYSRDQLENSADLADESASYYQLQISQGATPEEGAAAVKARLVQEQRVAAAGYNQDGGIWWVSSAGILGVYHPVIEGFKRAGPNDNSRSVGRRSHAAPNFSLNLTPAHSASNYSAEYLSDRSEYTPPYWGESALSEGRIPHTTTDYPQDRAHPIGSATSNVDDVRIKSTKALLISPYLHDFGSYDDYYGAWSTIETAQSCSLTPERAVLDSSVQLKDFKNWSSYGYIHISSHGDNLYRGLLSDWQQVWGPSDFLRGALSIVGVYTGLDLPRDTIGRLLATGYEDDLKQKRLAIGVGGTLVALPSFFDYYLDVLPNSVVVVSTCRSAYNDSLFNILLSKGAAGVVGFDDYVLSSYAQNTTNEIVQSMLNGRTFGEAVSDAKSRFGESDNSSDDARLVVRGNSGLKLSSGELNNGDFESGLLTPWETTGDGRVIRKLGITGPTGGQYMGVISTGLGFTTLTGEIAQNICLSGAASKLRFSWNFFSEEFTEYCGNVFDDSVKVELCERGENLPCTTVFQTRVNVLCQNQSALTKSDISFDQGDVYYTGWRHEEIDISAFSGKSAELRFFATDVGDSVYDTAILFDDIRIE